MAADQRSGVLVRRATEADDQAVVALLSDGLGWGSGDLPGQFFRWKHRANPFGQSWAWVAVADGRVVAYRSFMPWEFRAPDGSVRHAARAVDTVVDATHRRQGLFRRLTLHGIEEMTSSGVEFVFNTPNENSRPGYVSMGWSLAGRIPVAIKPRGLSVLRRGAAPVSKQWSVPSDVGLPAGEALAGEAGRALAGNHRREDATATRVTAEFLRWRLAFPALHYRFMPISRDPSDGGVVFRVRRRGTGLVAVVIEALCLSRRDAGVLMASIVRQAKVDYAIVGRHSQVGRTVPAPGRGPVVTLRSLATEPPSANSLALTMSDGELF
jgi:GNAT superfamily N-acetyltransferase